MRLTVYNVRTMPEELQKPQYEIGHFHCDLHALTQGKTVKYIVAEVAKDLRYLLHLDSDTRAHIGVLLLATRANADYGQSRIIGGGQVMVASAPSSHGIIVSLVDYSMMYGMEPKSVRDAFQPLVAAKLRELGLDVTDEQQ